MKRITVDSSNIASIGYDPETMTLEVEFTNGNIYQYFDIPPSLQNNLMLADSKGKFLHTQIKGVYRYSRL